MEVKAFKHVCKFCNKRFPCGRSLGGHIRSHLPKPGYELKENLKKTSLDSSLTETENPKLSKMDQNQCKKSSFVRNNEDSYSYSSVSEVVEEEQKEVVAMCLIMLSQDVGSWGNEISSSFVNDSEFIENDSFLMGKNYKKIRKRKIQGNDSVSGAKIKEIKVSGNGFLLNDEKTQFTDSKRKIGQITASGYFKMNEFEDSENGLSLNDEKKSNLLSVREKMVKLQLMVM